MLLLNPMGLNEIFAGVVMNDDGGAVRVTSIDPNVAVIGQVVIPADERTGLYRVIDTNKATFLDRITSFEVKPYYYQVDTHGYLVKVEEGNE